MPPSNRPRFRKAIQMPPLRRADFLEKGEGMKISGEVIAVATTGENLQISIQARIGRAKWRPIAKFEVFVPDLLEHRKAFYVGRLVSVSLKAKP